MKINKVAKGKQEYYYLEHSYREGKKVKKKSLYLGKEIPKNILVVREKFKNEFYKEKYLDDIDKIKNNFEKQLKKTPKYAKEKELKTFGIIFTYNSQRIEGSTLTRKETADFLERGITPSRKPVQDLKEAEAHEKLFQEMLKTPSMNFQKVILWNKKLLLETDEKIAGKIRNHDVRIARSKFIPPMHIELDFLLKEFFDWYTKNKKKVHPVELAALVHLKFVTIHPFSDGNGRTSRMMMNFVLKDNNYPLTDITYENREGYYNALESSNIENNENIFVEWFFKRYVKEYKRYLE